MPIKWNPLKVKEAADQIEELVKEAAEPLAKAKAATEAALAIPNLPQYVTGHLHQLSGEIGRVTGGVERWSNRLYPGSIRKAIADIRESLPKDALAEAEVASNQQSLL